MRYIIVWRRNPRSRSIDVHVTGTGEIATFDSLPDNHYPVLDDEADLIEYVNSEETESRFVDADLAHRILGWTIPS